MESAFCSTGQMVVRPYTDSLEAEWDDFVRAQGPPLASIFHLTAWKRIIERAFGFAPRYLVAEEQGFIVGVLPMFLVQNRLMGKALISTPFAVYGGACGSSRAAQMLRRAACDLAKQENVEYLELREQTATEDPDFAIKHLYVTFDQRLPETPETLLQHLPRDTRYMIRKAQKNGLQYVQDNGQLDIFYELYAHSVQNLGTPVFSRRFFQILLEELGSLCEIAVIWQKSVPLAAVLSLRFGDWILPYYGGSVAEGKRLAANNFMYWEVMKRAVEAGIAYFDFGRSKLGTGAYAFKTQWNMKERPLPYHFYLLGMKTLPNYSPTNPRFKMAIEVWKRLPFAVTKWVGPSLVKLFP